MRIKKPIRSLHAKHVNVLTGLRCSKFYFLSELESSTFLRKISKYF